VSAGILFQGEKKQMENKGKRKRKTKEETGTTRRGNTTMVGTGISCVAHECKMGKKGDYDYDIYTAIKNGIGHGCCCPPFGKHKGERETRETGRERERILQRKSIAKIEGIIKSV